MMNSNIRKCLALVSAIVLVTAASTRVRATTATCGGQMITIPFEDVSASSIFFCSIAEAYFSGLTNGTTPTTYSPDDPVTREQMAAFITRTMDQSRKRESRRAGLKQFWTTTPLYDFNLGVTTLGGAFAVAADGTDIWVAEGIDGHVSSVRASDGAGLSFWSLESGISAEGVLCAMGRVFVIGINETTAQSELYMIDPTAPPGAATLLTSELRDYPIDIAFDGYRIWTANDVGNSVSILTRRGIGTMPWTVTTVAGFPLALGIREHLG